MSAEYCTVRTAKRGDLEAVLQLHADQAAVQNRTAVTATQKRTWERMMTASELTVYVAETADAVIGTATAIVVPNVTYSCAPTAFVEAVVVLREHRQRGVATILMKHILDDAGALGCNKVQLLSHKRHASDGAHRLYTNLGFVAEAEGFRLYLRAGPSRLVVEQPGDNSGE